MEDMHLKAFEALPHSATCRLIDFEKADVVPGFASKTFFLIVAGIKPWLTLKVELHPLIYVQQPDYWGVEVVACQDGIGQPQSAPYHAQLDITHLLGTKGIEVIGATGRKRFNVP
jgi:hypothetical protein